MEVAGRSCFFKCGDDMLAAAAVTGLVDRAAGGDRSLENMARRRMKEEKRVKCVGEERRVRCVGFDTRLLSSQVELATQTQPAGEQR